MCIHLSRITPPHTYIAHFEGRVVHSVNRAFSLKYVIIIYFYLFVIFHLGFEDHVSVLIVPVPGHCFRALGHILQSHNANF